MSGRMLNVGCGHRRHPDWVNIDQHAWGPDVRVHDLRRPVPFADGTFDVVYHSHVLEHLSRPDARALLTECRRVLASGGLLRVVVPDLEQIARAYLAALDAAARDADPHARANHEWMVIEMVDQLVRHEPGGELVRYVDAPGLSNADFVTARWGSEGRGVIADRARARAGQAKTTGWTTAIARLRQVRRYPLYLREAMLRLVLGAGYHTWALGRYRQSGDAHLWMYDRVSLPALLRDCGFTDVSVTTAFESRVSGWGRFHLDVDADGAIYRPNSLFVEGLRGSTA